MRKPDQLRRVYVAAFFGSKERIVHEINRLELFGAAKVISTWHTEAITTTSQAPAGQIISAEEVLAIAERDVREIDSLGFGDVLIADTFDISERGGREWEAGYAYGLGTAVWIVGPKRNVFHHLCPHFDTWDDVIDLLLKEDAEAQELPRRSFDQL